MAQNDVGSRKLMTYILLNFSLIDRTLMVFRVKFNLVVICLCAFLRLRPVDEIGDVNCLQIVHWLQAED